MADINPAEILPTDEFIRRWTNAEYLALLQRKASDTAQGRIGNSKNFDIVMAGDVLRINSQKATSLKADLVSDGILTQARADVIFGPVTGG